VLLPDFAKRSSTLIAELAAPSPPFVEGQVIDNDAVNAGCLAAQQIFCTGFKFGPVSLKAGTPFSNRSTDQSGGVVQSFTRHVDDDFLAMAVGDEPKSVPIDEIIRAEGDWVRPQSDSAIRQEFDLGGLQGLLNS